MTCRSPDRESPASPDIQNTLSARRYSTGYIDAAKKKEQDYESGKFVFSGYGSGIIIKCFRRNYDVISTFSDLKFW